VLFSYTQAAAVAGALALAACAIGAWCLIEIRRTRRVLRADLAAAAGAELRRLTDAVHGARARIDALTPFEQDRTP
jgi:hypothetical protein